MRYLLSALCAGLATLSIANAQESSRTLPTLNSPKPPAVTKLQPRFTALPYKGGTSDNAIMMQAAAGSTIPLWNGSATVGRRTYKYKMVGRDPAVGNSPDIPTVVVPVKMVFNSGADVFDPTAADPSCSPNGKPITLMENSPVFKNIRLRKLGSGQYTSLFQRGNYYTINPTYRVNLNPVTTTKLVTVTVNGGDVYNAGGCQKLGMLDIGSWDSFVQGTLIPGLASQGVNPSSFPIFLFYNVVMFDGSESNCCILGYHSAFNNPSAGGAFQTYSTSDYDSSGVFSGTSDISVLTHEVAEWLDDPNAINPTPPWGHIGQVTGCQNNLEVGDPLSGTIEPIALGGMTYHVQDLAFTSWFYRQKPPTTYNGRYSLFATLKRPAAACN
jgi:hypothetical protein